MKNSDESKYQADLLLLLRELQGNTELYDAETAYNFFHEKHCLIVNKHYPWQTLTRKQRELELKPWITKGILTSSQTRTVQSLTYVQDIALGVCKQDYDYLPNICHNLRQIIQIGDTEKTVETLNRGSIT